MPRSFALGPWLVAGASAALLAGCAGAPSLSDKECLARAMYFESNRSSPDGMLAVGTTVMNRVDDPKFPKSVCAVVGQPHQFAPGVLDKPMDSRGRKLAAEMAERVLAGERHPQLPADAMYFHTAGYSFPYTNMHYVLVAGGNAFYEKIPGGANQPPSPADRPAPVPDALRMPAAESVAQASEHEPAEPAAADGSLVTFGSPGAVGAPPGPRLPDDDAPEPTPDPTPDE